MYRKLNITASVFGVMAIVLGAFGAHALKKVIGTEQLNSFEIGVRYQMYHALFLLFIGLTSHLSENVKKQIWMLVTFGVLLFSGSIYLLSTNELTGFDFKIIGFITPIGGLMLILSWLLLLINFIKKTS